MSENTSQSNETRSEAQSLIQNILKFNFLVLLHFWNVILGKIDCVQKRLQDPQMNFHEAAKDLNALASNLLEIRDQVCQSALQNGKEKCQEWGLEIVRRVRRVKMRLGEKAADSGLSAEQEIDRIMKEAIDRLIQELKTRFMRLNDVDEKFGFLLNVEELLADTSKWKEQCREFGVFYSTDVNSEDLHQEIIDCKMLLRGREEIQLKTPLDLLKFIISYGHDVFPNLRIALQILLTIATSIASCERSFSKLKLVLSYLRSSMGQQRLNDLSLISIERNEAAKINFDEVIDSFANSKARRTHI